MRQTSFLPLLAFVLLLSACGDSSLPTVSGKGNIRAVNGISSAPSVSFLIEERSIGAVDYRQITPLGTTSSYDDLNYTFNFEVRFLGEAENRRIASQNLDVVKDMDYILLLTGTLDNPSVLTWETTTRSFDASATVFETRFAHTSDSLGNADYYFAAPGVAPVLGEAVGTLSFGDVLTSVDYTAGDFVLTITASGDPGNILFQSDTMTYTAAVQYLITSFDGDANTFAPIVARAFTTGAGGTALTLADINYPSTTEFVNGSIALNTVDVYDDEMLTSQIVDDLAYTDVSAELNLAPGVNTFYVTPSDSLSPLLVEDTVNFFAGIRGRSVAYGAADAQILSNYVPDRRPVDTQAKLQLFNAAVSLSAVDLYIVTPGTAVEDSFTALNDLGRGAVSPVIALIEGNFELYITEAGTTDINILAGPIALDVAYGDVLGGVIFDSADPAVFTVGFLPNNP